MKNFIIVCLSILLIYFVFFKNNPDEDSQYKPKSPLAPLESSFDHNGNSGHDLDLDLPDASGSGSSSKGSSLSKNQYLDNSKVKFSDEEMRKLIDKMSKKPQLFPKIREEESSFVNQDLEKTFKEGNSVNNEIQNGISGGWIVTYNPEYGDDFLFIHSRKEGGYLKDLKYIAIENENNWDVYSGSSYRPSIGRSSIGKSAKITTIRRPSGVSKGKCGC